MWSLEGSMARWESASVRLRVNVEKPDLGLHDIGWCGTMLSELRLLRVSAMSCGGDDYQLEDVYVRGRDVVASFAQTAHSPLRTQVYWRISQLPEVDAAVVLEAIVSAQTQLLDSDPRVEISSVLTGREWYALRAAAAGDVCESLAVDAERPCMLHATPDGAVVLARLPESMCTYGQIIPRADLVAARISCDAATESTQLATVYFAARLEKGVLRRTRIPALLLPRHGDVQHLRHYWSMLQLAAPPLTT